MVGFPLQGAQPGFSFGQAAAPQTGIVSPFLQSGTNTTTTAVVTPFSSTVGGFSFASPTAPTQPASAGLGTGLFTVPSQTASPFGQQLNSPVASSTAAAPSLAPAFNFSTPPAPIGSTPPGGLGLFSVSGTTGVSTTPSSGFSFAPPKPATAAPAASLFSLTPSQAPAPVSIGLGGSLPAASSLTTPLGGGGLGGIQAASSSSGGDSTLGKTEGQSLKEAPLPQDIFASIAEFESYKDSEKKACEENIRQTAAPFHKLGEDAKKLRHHVTKLSNQHQQLHTSARKMKTSVIEQSTNVEMAIRTHATPASLQGDNKAPEIFFLNLIRSFEEKMTFCRNKIEEVDNCSRAGQMKDISPQDLKKALRMEHDTMKSLAAKVYTLHGKLGELHERANNPNVTKPEMLFKPTIGEDSGGIGTKASSILRPCFSDVSGLLEFQTGQQRAKSISLGGAAPPILSLNQTTLGSSLFGTSSIFQSTPGVNSVFKPSPFGSQNNTISSPFASSFGGQNSSIFGANTTNTTNNNNSFGLLKTFGKTAAEQDESQKKRRM